MGSRDIDPAYFFAGEVPTYGQTVSPNDVIVLAYLRAMRRIDPCGLVTRDAMAKIGEIGSVGTLFALEECDVDIKVPGETERRYATFEVTLAPADDARVALRAATFRSTRPNPAPVTICCRWTRRGCPLPSRCANPTSRSCGSG